MAVTYIHTGPEAFSRVTVTGAAVLVTGTTVFTVSGGPIRVTDLVSYCITTCDTTASTLRWSADQTGTPAAATFTGASASLASFAAGGIIVCDLTALTTAPVITGTNGVALGGPATSTGGGVYIPPGIITTTIAIGSTTGTFKHYLRWMPMHPTSNVVAAF